MADLALAFLWHQHQPYYPDDVSGENPMPWVRLHGVKDYYGMALHLKEFPEMRCTINLVPSLIVQLRKYVEEGGTDRFLDVSRIPADALAEDDVLFLLDHFFMANPHHMILPHPRYAELYQRRGLGKNVAAEAVRRFHETDLRDLQVWFNLTWIHPLAFAEDDNLRELRAKGRHFTEAEKRWLLDQHREILARVLPLHRELEAGGQIELTTTPFFHPILPLLLDKKLALEAMPNARLPRHTAGYPEDAEVQVRRAVEYHQSVFGRAPQGMWPAEGSVCQSMIPLLARHGIRWIATDEEILSGSTRGEVSRDGRGHVRNPERLYRAYRVAQDGADLGIVFRDHALSDMIGFHYQRSDPVAAADDFTRHILAIREAVRGGDDAIVSVILDGENCWEHYPTGGVPFLRALYERCVSTRGIRPTPVGEFLQKHPPRDTLSHLMAGSWISRNFAIWIGHEEDNNAWDALHRTREHLQARSGAGRGEERRVPAADVQRAWEEIYIAEGSDWFWWFGDDHSSAQDALFDALFRKHLQNVYSLLGDAPPPGLARPISRHGGRAVHSLPRNFIAPRIDGLQTFFEWVGAGRYSCQNERGTMAMASPGPMRDVYFSFNADFLFVRVDFDLPARRVLADHDGLRIGFVEPPGWELWAVQEQDATPGLNVRMLRNGVPISAERAAGAADQIFEAAIPFQTLEVKPEQPLQFFVELLRDRQGRDRAPREGTINLTCPSPGFENLMWDV